MATQARKKGLPNLVTKRKKLVKRGVRRWTMALSTTVLSGVRSLPEIRPSIIMTRINPEIMYTSRNKMFLAQLGNMVSLSLTQVEKLPNSFFNRKTLAVARELLGKYLVRQIGNKTV